MDEERIETHDAREIWLHGTDDEHPDRQCPNCSEPIETDRLEEPDPDDGLMLCPDCGAELPYGAIKDVPISDWFNWVCLEKIPYDERPCFEEPTQAALRLGVSLADPRGSDVGLEITQTKTGVILVKVENRTNFTYYPHIGTSVEGSYTVVRFKP